MPKEPKILTQNSVCGHSSVANNDHKKNLIKKLWGSDDLRGSTKKTLSFKFLNL
jgi:hypothetical protein